MATHRIAVLPGDGIGQEVTAEAVRVLRAVTKGGASLEFEQALVGGAAIDAAGTPLPPATLALCRGAAAILFGAVGGPKWDGLPQEQRAERGLLAIRKELDLYANLRPATCFPMLVDASPLKRSVVEGTDIVVIRELTGGLYYGEPRGREKIAGGERAVNTMVYTTPEIERVARVGFEVARKRRRRLTSVDKANVLTVSQLWREVVTRVGKDYPDVTLEHVLVDNCAMALVQKPTQFDTIVTENTFGDILSDEAAILAGSMGMLPSASLGGVREGGGNLGLYEPVHGTAPDIAGQGVANPIAAILSAAMLLRYSLNMAVQAERVEKAVRRVLQAGHRTRDIAGPGEKALGTREMGDLVVRHVEQGGLMAAGVTVAVVGATGAAGQTTLRILEERKFPVRELRCFASERSVGKTVTFQGEAVPVRRFEAAAFKGVDIAICSAGSSQSKEYAPLIVAAGAIVVDKSNAWRMDPTVPLIVPEINAHAVRGHAGILASPNCTTIVTVLPLKPLHDAGRLRRVVATSYQAVSGAGVNGIAALREETLAWARGEAITPKHFAHRIAFNLIPAIDRFGDDGYTGEEMKLVHETRKILELPDLAIAPTTVRVPVFTCHSVAVIAETDAKITAARARELFAGFPGLRLCDEPGEQRYPMPIDVEGQDDCFVGRVREDLSHPRGLSFWVVGDQLRKGAATNAVQIAELVLRT